MKISARLLLAQMTAYSVSIQPLAFDFNFQEIFIFQSLLRLDNFFIPAVIQEFSVSFSYTFIFLIGN